MKAPLKRLALLVLLGVLAGACPFADELREYLDRRFWQPFAHSWQSFAKPGVVRAQKPFAGMLKSADGTPLAKLRIAYFDLSVPGPGGFDTAPYRAAVAAALASPLSARDREEVELIDAKIDMRAAQPESPESFNAARDKLLRFLRTARTPELLSEARGWLAYVYYQQGNRTAAGKAYLDELNRPGSTHSRDSVLASLSMNYGNGGVEDMFQHLEEYFDTADHAVFAVTVVTRPVWERMPLFYDAGQEREVPPPARYAKVVQLLKKHAALLRGQSVSASLALLSMRTALRMGDPAEALRLAAAIPAGSAVLSDPDYLWMLASSRYLTRQYAEAEQPLLELFRSPSAGNRRAAAAYGLCGVYQRAANRVEQLHYALWLREFGVDYSAPGYLGRIEDLGVYWATSGWDLGLLLDTEASIDDLRAFLERYPRMRELRLVRYALAVRLSRLEQYEEAARIYEEIHAIVRAPRTRRLAELHRLATRPDAAPAELLQARFEEARFLAENPNRIYYNDTLWGGLQRYALQAEADYRLGAADRQAQLAAERSLRDGQEELWQAVLKLRAIAREAGDTDLGHRAARLAITSLRQISERFGREDERRRTEIALARWLAKPAAAPLD